MAEGSLFARLGYTENIARLVDAIVAAHLVNPQIQARFTPYVEDPERMSRIKGHLCAFLEAGCGGPAAYSGRSMRDAHRGMNISEAEFIAALDDIHKVLREHGVDEATQKDVIAMAYSLKDDIMHV